MKILVISACTDPFSHSPMKVQVIKNSLDYSEADREKIILDYEDALKRGQFSKLSIHLIEVSPETGEVTVLINRIGENPIKTKIVVNPKAKEVREARLARAKDKVSLKSFFSTDTTQPSAPLTDPVSWDEFQ